MIPALRFHGLRPAFWAAVALAAALAASAQPGPRVDVKPEAEPPKIEAPGRSEASLRRELVVRASPGFVSDCRDCQMANRKLRGWRIAREMHGSDFSEADLSAAKMMQSELAGAKFRSANLAAADATGALLEGADFTNAGAAEAKFTDARLADAQFVLTRAENADFSAADLRRANFTLARLDAADFAGANLRGAQFDRARLPGADLAKARNLTQAQLRFACGDADTKLPRGLRIRRCAKATS
jgi:uncharacterized protein YjbI with pentapeptide repeats